MEAPAVAWGESNAFEGGIQAQLPSENPRRIQHIGATIAPVESLAAVLHENRAGKIKGKIKGNAPISVGKRPERLSVSSLAATLHTHTVKSWYGNMVEQLYYISLLWTYDPGVVSS